MKRLARHYLADGLTAIPATYVSRKTKHIHMSVKKKKKIASQLFQTLFKKYKKPVWRRGARLHGPSVPTLVWTDWWGFCICRGHRVWLTKAVELWILSVRVCSCAGLGLCCGRLKPFALKPLSSGRSLEQLSFDSFGQPNACHICLFPEGGESSWATMKLRLY